MNNDLKTTVAGIVFGISMLVKMFFGTALPDDILTKITDGLAAGAGILGFYYANKADK